MAPSLELPVLLRGSNNNKVAEVRYGPIRSYEEDKSSDNNGKIRTVLMMIALLSISVACAFHAFSSADCALLKKCKRPVPVPHESQSVNCTTPTFPPKLPASAPLSRNSSSKQLIVDYINSIAYVNATLRYDHRHQQQHNISSFSASSPRSPEEKALAWLVDEDPLQQLSVPRDADRLRQRYALLCLWFHTGGPHWNFRTPADDDWLRRKNAKHVDNECLWEGINCTECSTTVASIRLDGHQLQGRIPADLGLLSGLTYLTFWYQNLTGTIPPSLFQITTLEVVDLFHTCLTGTIPSQLSDLTALRVFSAGENSLSGTIPSLSRLTALDTLFLRLNRLTGPLPAALPELTALTRLQLAVNRLTGTLDGLDRLTDLEILELSDNDLTGSIPSSLSSLTALTLLDLGSNSNMIPGPIPTALAKLTGLYNLALGNCSRIGTIPSALGELTNLYELDLSYNQLSGTIPSRLAELPVLVRLYLDHNDFLTGTIPIEFEHAPVTPEAYFQRNNLTGTMPLCHRKSEWSASTLIADCAKVQCACCTACCPGIWSGIHAAHHC